MSDFAGSPKQLLPPQLTPLFRRSCSRLKELKKAGVDIVSHQVQMSALDSRPVQGGMNEWCAENGVKLIAFGTVGGGF